MDAVEYSLQNSNDLSTECVNHTTVQTVYLMYVLTSDGAPENLRGKSVVDVLTP